MRPPWRLRTHLMAVVLLAILPGVVIAAVTAWHVSNSFVDRFDHTLSRMATVMAIAVDRQMETTARAATAAFAGGGSAWEEGRPAAPPGIARALAALGVEGTLWRQAGGEWRPEPVAAPGGLAADAMPGLRAAVARVALSRHRELFAAPADSAGDAAWLSLLVPLPDGAAARGVVQVALPPALVDDMLGIGEARRVTASRLIGADGRVAGRSPGPDPAHVGRLPDILPVGAEDAADFETPRVVAAGGAPDVFASAALPGDPRWRVAVIQCTVARTLRWTVSVAEFAAAVGSSLLLALAAAAWLGTRLARPLVTLKLEASVVAANGDLPGAGSPLSGVREFNELRASLGRSTAVLRRRAAAERMALNEARTGHELLASVVTATEDLIYVKNLELRIVLANRATLACGGVRREEWHVLGRTIAALMPNDAALLEEALDRRVLAGGGSDHTRLEWPGADGVTRSFMLTKSPWRDASGRITGVVTVAHDVTEQRADEARLASVQADLLRVSRLSAMGAMASGLAHELNQPLAAATNFLNAAGRLLRQPGMAPGAGGTLQARADGLARTAVADAAEQMLRAGDIVRRLRAFIGRGEAALRPEDVGEVIREGCALARADGAAGAAELVVRESGLGEVALLDRTQLQQVLLNLIRNASEALADSAEPRIEISCARIADGGTCITVSDNGPGLAPDVAQRLFEPFVSTKPHGMGIGLAICRTIVEGHGGRLGVAQTPDGWTVFSIHLPAARARHAREPAHAA